MAPQHAYLSVHDPVLPAPVATPSRDHLAVVPTDPVFLTFADGVELRRTGPVWRRVRRRFPAGLVHAAEPYRTAALCGASVESLEAFGRSRHPFERFEVTRRCPRCDAAAGRPTG